MTDRPPAELGAAVAALARGRIEVTVDEAGPPTRVSVQVPARAPVLERRVATDEPDEFAFEVR